MIYSPLGSCCYPLEILKAFVVYPNLGGLILLFIELVQEKQGKKKCTKLWILRNLFAVN